MGSNYSTEQQQNKHIVLLGDSTFDNKGYVGKEGLSIGEHLAKLGVKTTLLARDGGLISAINQQINHVPQDATDIVISIGGNDGLCSVSLLHEPTKTVEEGMIKFCSFVETFEKEYYEMVENVVKTVGSRCNIILCSIYNPAFSHHTVNVSQNAANIATALISDAVGRTASKFGLPVIDWRRVMTEVQDFANPIEPASIGGGKMAKVILEVANRHPFSTKAPIIYPWLSSMNAKNLIITSAPSEETLIK